MAKVTKKSKKKKVAKKTEKKTEPKKPGVIASILEFISDNPMTPERILQKLVKRFPDRNADGMEKTIHAQLPSRMAKERKIKITKDKDGRYFAKS